MAEEPIVAMMIPYTSATGPPLYKTVWKVRATLSHDACNVSPNETIGLREMYLCQKLMNTDPDEMSGRKYIKFSSVGWDVNRVR
jgi:hypothetical protein